ncbi:MAG: metallophosphoesterase [Lentisphaeria bacterium]|nr:metallophosphoesterase [Lentisphaeria bacterium]
MPKILLFLFCLSAFAVVEAAEFRHSLPDGKKPWTHENFISGDKKFSFVIIPDRTGSERPGVFEQALKKANLLQPDFIMSVGDLIQGPTRKDKQSSDHLREQWQELIGFTEKSQAPFFYIVGNHDISRTRAGFPRANEDSTMVWKEFAGNNTYYSFIYKDVLFLCLNSMEGRDSRVPQIGITDRQADWAIDVLKKHPDVRWTMVFVHNPSAWISENYIKIQKVLHKRKYTSFAGDWHHYIKFKRYGHDYYVLATAGGVSQMRGIDYGEFDHITWVTVTENGPTVANILLDGILSDDVTTAQTIKRHYSEILDTEPFVSDPGKPWRAVVDTYKLKSGTGNEFFQIDGNLLTLSGKKTAGQKVVSKVIDIDHPSVGGKTLQIVSAIRAELPAGRKSSFNLHVRILDDSERIIKCEGFTFTESCPWKYRDCLVKVPAEGKKLQLVFAGVGFDDNSIGETRNTFIFER